MVENDLERVEAELAAGRLACPACGARHRHHRRRRPTRRLGPLPPRRHPSPLGHPRNQRTHHHTLNRRHHQHQTPTPPAPAATPPAPTIPTHGVAAMLDLNVGQHAGDILRHDPAPTARQRRREELDAEAERIFEASGGTPRTYGSPRIHAELAENGWAVAEKTVADSMTRQGVVPAQTAFRSLTRRYRAVEPLRPVLASSQVDQPSVASQEPAEAIGLERPAEPPKGVSCTGQRRLTSGFASRLGSKVQCSSFNMCSPRSGVDVLLGQTTLECLRADRMSTGAVVRHQYDVPAVTRVPTSRSAHVTSAVPAPLLQPLPRTPTPSCSGTTSDVPTPFPLGAGPGSGRR